MKKLLRVTILLLILLLFVIGTVQIGGARMPFPPIVAIPYGGSTQFYMVSGGQAALLLDTWGTPTSFCPADNTQVLLQDYFSFVDKLKRLALLSGREPQKLGKGLPDISFFPVWSPDCRHIAFLGRTPTSMPEIYSMDADGTNVRELTTDDYSKSAVAISPNGAQIAYLESVDDVSMVIMDYPGTVQKHLIPITKGWFIATMVWSPDGTKVAVALDSAMGKLQVVVVTVDAFSVLFTVDCASDPAWSPDGKFLVYESGCSYLDPTRELVKFDVQSRKTHVLASWSGLIETGVRWISSDHILFLTYKISQEYESEAYDWEIHEVQADGSGLTTISFFDSKPTYSPSSLEKLVDGIGQSVRKFLTNGLSAGGTMP